MFHWPRIFSTNSSEDIESQINDIVPVDTVAVAIPSHTSSSNNILNSNLSGSFRDSDDEQLMERNIYEPISSNMDTNQLQQSIPEMAPSSSTSTQTSHIARLGVAAIPNTQFCPTTPLSSRTNRHANNDNDDFVV